MKILLILRGHTSMECILIIKMKGLLLEIAEVSAY